MTDFIYWEHPTPVGIMVAEVSGCENRSGRTWLEMARQIYSENGKDSYREISHTQTGAPLLEGSNRRISISHSDHLLVIASLPPTPECELDSYNRRSALGIDCEHPNRAQVIKVRNKFLSDDEQAMIPADDVKLNILAWTIKEAVYKALLQPGIDFRNSISILSLPELKEFDPFNAGVLGKARFLPEGNDDMEEMFEIYSYLSDDYVVTLAFNQRCAKFSAPKK